METLPRQKYTKEFREQAVRLMIEQDLTVPRGGKALGDVKPDALELGV